MKSKMKTHRFVVMMKTNQTNEVTLKAIKFAIHLASNLTEPCVFTISKKKSKSK